MLFARRCVLCDRLGESLCRRCRRGLPRSGPVSCPAGLDSCAAVVRHENTGRDLVLALKYRNRRAHVAWLAARMAARSGSSIDLVTWIPTSPARRRVRGFDQAEVLARAVARRLGVPCVRLLAVMGSDPQTGRGAAARLGRDDLRSTRPATGHRILVVDDVLTTGATLAAGARTLRGAGAVEVHAVVASQRP